MWIQGGRRIQNQLLVVNSAKATDTRVATMVTHGCHGRSTFMKTELTIKEE